MAQFQFDASQVAPSTGGSMPPMPAGWYPAIIVESEMKRNSKNDGDILTLKYKIIQGDFAERFTWCRLNVNNPNADTQTFARADLSAICHAVQTFRFQDTAELHNKPHRIKLKVRPASDDGKYEAQNDVVGFRNINDDTGPIPTKAMQQAATGAAPAAATPAWATAPAPGAAPAQQPMQQPQQQQQYAAAPVQQAQPAAQQPAQQQFQQAAQPWEQAPQQQQQVQQQPQQAQDQYAPVQQQAQAPVQQQAAPVQHQQPAAQPAGAGAPPWATGGAPAGAPAGAPPWATNQ